MPNVIQTSNSRGGPSPDLWRGDQPNHGQYFNDPNKGWGYFDNFHYFGASGNGYTLQEADATASIGLIATEGSGVVRLAITGTDNAEANMQFGISEGVIGKVDGGSGEVFFEARFRTSSIADNTNGIVIGLAEEGSAGANLQADNTGVLADKDFIGFQTLQADGDSLNVIHNVSGGGGITTLETGFATLVADTWTKVGLWFDGDSKVRFYLNGRPSSTTVLESATNFPDGEELNFIVGAKVGSDNALNLDVDWWAYAQECTS